MTNAQAKGMLERLRRLQIQPEGRIFPCPRCGQGRMNPDATRNMLSTRVYVYICSQCRMDEDLREMEGIPPLPFNEWEMALGFDEA